MRLAATATFCLAAAFPGPVPADDLQSATTKVDAIKSDQLRAGTRVNLSPRELSAYAQSQVPQGVRAATVHIPSPGIATGSAMVDIDKVCRSHGIQPFWGISKLLGGEHPVTVTAGIHSKGGTATVVVNRAEISGLPIDTRLIDLLVQYVVLPLYPGVTLGRPFELGHNIDRIDVRPASVEVLIGAKQ
jgi:hypothetical protein